MIVTYVRSSSLKNFDYCQHQYFLTYVLGLEQLSNLKAEKGTIVHKVLECLAELKVQYQQNPNSKLLVIEDDALGTYSCTVDDLYRITELTDEQVDRVNKTRVNKETYKDDCFIKYGHRRTGVKIVEELIEKSFNFYIDRSRHNSKPVDLKDCHNFTWMTLDYRDGVHDPRKCEIVSPEQHFDIPIEYDWAKFEYDYRGEKISGNLAIKGTIDLVTRNPMGILELVDYKTGQRLDWGATPPKKKELSDFYEDEQLMLYYYAASKIYNTTEIILTIFYIRDGGPFSIFFDETTLTKFENILKRKVKKIQRTKAPKLLDYRRKDFRCNRLCTYYKNGKCKEIHNDIIKIGMDKTIEKHTKKGFNINRYEAPGE